MLLLLEESVWADIAYLSPYFLIDWYLSLIIGGRRIVRLKRIFADVILVVIALVHDGILVIFIEYQIKAR